MYAATLISKSQGLVLRATISFVTEKANSNIRASE